MPAVDMEPRMCPPPLQVRQQQQQAQDGPACAAVDHPLASRDAVASTMHASTGWEDVLVLVSCYSSGRPFWLPDWEHTIQISL